MIQERCVHRFADGIIPAKRKRNVADPAAHPGAGQVAFDPARRVDEIRRVIAVLFKPGGNREHVRVENDVAGRKIQTLC